MHLDNEHWRLSDRSVEHGDPLSFTNHAETNVIGMPGPAAATHSWGALLTATGAQANTQFRPIQAAEQ